MKSEPTAPAGGEGKRHGVVARIKQAGLVLTAVAGLLGLLPAVAVITGLVDIPPTLEQLVKMITVPISIVSVLAVVIFSEPIHRMSPKWSIVLFGSCTLLGAAATVEYFVFAHRHVVPLYDERVVIPVHPSPLIMDIVEVYDGDYGEALRSSSRRDALRDEMDKGSGPAIIIMVTLMLAAQMLLIAGMVGGLWKAVVGSAPRESGRLRSEVTGARDK